MYVRSSLLAMIPIQRNVQKQIFQRERRVKTNQEMTILTLKRSSNVFTLSNTNYKNKVIMKTNVGNLDALPTLK